MSANYHFHPLSQAEPEGWRALDRAVARWVHIHGGSPLLAQVAGWASLAEGNGDSALPLLGADANRHGMPPLSNAEREALRSESLVGKSDVDSTTPSDTPFVVEYDRFYLRRNYLYEQSVSRHIQVRRAARLPSGRATEADLDVLFHGHNSAEVQPQRNAVGQVLGCRLFVLTGGPGTGKTTTVLRMLLMLAKDRAERGLPAPVVRISAPTGKAAQRLSESLRDGAKRLCEDPVRPLPSAWHAHLACALAAEASTLHRLLGSRGRHGGFKHHADNPLPSDIVLVDEASMVDLSMLRVLLDALKPDTALILVGDADQLTSVGTGSALLDLVTALESSASPALVRLHHSFRADKSLVPINAAVLRGDHVAFAAAVGQAGAKATLRRVATTVELRHALGPWCRQLRQSLKECGAFDAVSAQRHDLVLKALDGLRQRQLLCALRETEFGAAQVNTAIEQTLNRQLDGYDSATWYPGRAVMITRNDYVTGLFNGDVGLCLRDEHGQLGVWFEVTAQASGSADVQSLDTGLEAHRRVVRFAPGSLPDHQGAFAVTIHKSQGSEYGHVALLLPPDAGNRILSRQLLYTGASRAKQALEIWGTEAVIKAAIDTPVQRSSGLMQRLATPTAAPDDT